MSSSPSVTRVSTSIVLLLVSGFWILASLPAPAIVDTNNNALSDIWEQQYNNGNLIANLDHQADPDSDGWTNMEEAAAGTNPFDPNPPNGIIRPNIVHIPATYIPGTNGDPVIFTPEAITLTWPTLVGKQYTLHYSPDLSEGSWQPVEAPYIGNGTSTQYGITLTQENGSNPDKLFWHVAVEDIDTDGDSLTNHEESQLGTNPNNKDTDFDGIADNLDPFPLVSATIADPDGIGLDASLNNNLIGRWDFEALDGSGKLASTPESVGGVDISGTQALWDGHSAWAGGYTGMPSECMHLLSSSLASELHPMAFGKLPAVRFSGRNTQTWSMWLKFPEQGLNGLTKKRTIFAMGAFEAKADAKQNPHIHCYIHPGTTTSSGDDRINIDTYWLGGDNFTERNLASWAVPNGMSDGKWHHVAISFGNGDYCFYFDAQQAGVSSSYSVRINLVQTEGTPWCYVGRFRPTPVLGTCQSLGARIDRLRVYNRILSNSPANNEIKKLYQQDIDSDGLWDNTETSTRLWRDNNSDGLATANEQQFSVSPFNWQVATSDTDDDELLDLAEQTLGTSIGNPDTDGDLLPDGWENSYGMSPLIPGDAIANPDNDGLNNLDEYRYNTKPNLANSDGDSKNDGSEVNQGSDPNNADDGGNPIPAAETTSILLGIGDKSGSHSEDYILNCYHIDPQSGQEKRFYTLRSGGFGEYKEEIKSFFKKGKTYTFQIDWQSSNMSTKAATPGSPTEGPDYDYTFKVEPQGSDTELLIDAYDPKNKTVGAPILAASASDVATTESEFKQNFENKRVNLVPVDLDIEYGSQTGVLDDSKEDVGDGGYISLKSQTHQGEDITPTTYLVIRPTAGLPADGKVRLKFNSGGRYKVARDRLGNDPIVSEVTEFPAGQETRLYLVGETKSQSRGGEKITMQIKVGDSWVDGDSLKATVVQTQFQIDLRVFIPYNWVDVPFLPIVAGGDSRSYNPFLNGTYRISQKAILNLYKEWVPEVSNRLIDAGKSAGITKHYNLSDVSNYNVGSHHSEDTAIKPSSINFGATPSNSGIADLSGVELKVVNGSTNDTQCYVRFEGSATEPILPLAASINWQFDLAISKVDSLSPTFYMRGAHDGFPAYEIYVNAKHPIFPYTEALQWSPPLTADVWDLSKNLDVNVGPTTGVIKQ